MERRLDAQGLLTRIQDNGGPEHLDLSEYDLSNIEIDTELLTAEAGVFRRENRRFPLWLAFDPDEVSRLSLKRLKMEHAILHHVRFPGADFFDARMAGANFAGAVLSGASMMWCDLRQATFISAKLEGVDFHGARLDGADFDGAVLTGVNWSKAILHRARIAQSQLEPAIVEEIDARDSGNAEKMREAAESYIAHKLNFMSLGRYDEAAWAHVKAERLKRSALRMELKIGPKRALRPWLVWFLSWLWDRVSGYGQTPQRPLLIALGLVVVLYPLAYWLVGTPQDGNGNSEWWDHLIYSATSFGTLSYNRMQPSSDLASALSASEAFLGVLTFAVFIFILGNRVSPK